jgi:serine/threonine-protein kinase
MNESTPTDESLSPSQLDQVIAVCDRFEAAWKSGIPQPLEDLLPDVSELLRTAVFRQLLALELELRCKQGDRPTPAEYRDRFPDRAAEIAAVFAEAAPGASPMPPGSGKVPHSDAARNLLFGLLAFQNGFIDRDALLGAFSAWVADRARPIGQLLLDRGALDQTRHALLEALVAEHLKLHDGDPEQSLGDLSSVDAVASDLSRLPGEDVQASVAAVGRARTGAETTAPWPTGSGRRAGERFRILKLHAEGGLGLVYEAHDAELGRTVALKEIRPDRADLEQFRSRFVLEAEISGGLQHPGIVPVYSLGHYDDGKPFYAMRFVEGRSLREAVAEYHAKHPRPDAATKAFRDLLNRFLDVCNAVAFAHSRGVLHRDLKPHNVMIGDYGEALIIDWGLAKATGRRDPTSGDRPEATLVPPSGSGVEPTEAGQAIGTPAYMSPEQARGDLAALGPTTDVYGLGAILYHLLTGRAPVAGANQEEILARAIGREIAPPRSVNPNIPLTLEAVCLKALAMRPADRYPTARALADDLARWMAGEPVTARRDPMLTRLGRWARKHRVAAAALAASLVVGLAAALYGYRRERTHAADLRRVNIALDRQRERAEDREQQAIDAVKRFSDAISNEPLLKDTPELEALRRRLLGEPLSFFRSLRERLQADRDSRTDSLMRLADIAHEYAHVTKELGDPQDSLRSHKESLAIWDKLTRQDPHSDSYRLGLARILNCQSDLLNRTGDLAGARRSYETAQAIAQKLADDHPSVTDYQRLLAATHNNLGTLRSDTGDPAGAMRLFEAARAILQKLADDYPTVTGYQKSLATDQYNLGKLLSKTGDLSGARRCYEAARAIQQKLANDHPSVTGYQSDLAKTHNNLGLLMQESGDLSGARRCYEAARAIRQKLAHDHPSVADFQSGLARTQFNLGALLKKTNDVTGASRCYEAARAILQKLAHDHPSVADFQSELARTQCNLGGLLFLNGDPAGAKRSLEAARAILQKLAGDQPTVTDHRHHLAMTYWGLGALLIQTAYPDGARRSYEAARAILRKLADEQPTHADYQNHLAITLKNLGDLLIQTADPDGARRSYEAARAILQKLTADHPSVTDYQSRLAIAHNNLGALLIQIGDADGARRSYEADRAILHRLVREHPAALAYASRLGGTLNALAKLDLYSKKYVGARERLREAVEWQKKALAANPRNHQYQQLLANHLEVLIEATRGLGRDDEAEAAQRELDLLQASDPRFATLDARLAAIVKGEAAKDNAERLALAQRACDTRRYATAARLWSEALDSDPNLAENRQSQHRYNAVCAAALAAAGKGKDAPATDAVAMITLREQALAWLQAELVAWKEFLEKVRPERVAVVVRTLKHWQEDADLAGVRDAGALTKLPEAERTAWRSLWSEVAALIGKATQGPSDRRIAVGGRGDRTEVPRVETELPESVFARP